MAQFAALALSDWMWLWWEGSGVAGGGQALRSSWRLGFCARIPNIQHSIGQVGSSGFAYLRMRDGGMSLQRRILSSSHLTSHHLTSPGTEKLFTLAWGPGEAPDRASSERREFLGTYLVLRWDPAQFCKSV